VILDEFTYALKLAGSLSKKLQQLQKRPAMQHVSDYRGGRTTALIELADTVSEANLVKHAFQVGVQAMPGIEW